VAKWEYTNQPMHSEHRRADTRYPARSTHHWLGEEDLAAIGISIGTFRMSVGVENVEDLKEDLDQALKACREGGAK
jgi:O-acetylhomoserine/O-acetylserine sulfhydrylase-like pyridoxal-dependent enzyme